MNKKLIRIIEEAKVKLRNNPRDIVHDLAHHESVWENVKNILKEEKIEVDIDVLNISAYWHDVVLSKSYKMSGTNVEETAGYLENLLINEGFEKTFINKTISTMLNHEFLSEPSTIECLVLQDADKLDVLSSDRWKRTFEAYKRGEIDKNKLASYVQTGLKWLPLLVPSFYFDTTKQIASMRIKSVVVDKTFINLVKELGQYELYIDVKRILDSNILTSEAKKITKRTQEYKDKLING